MKTQLKSNTKMSFLKLVQPDLAKIQQDIANLPFIKDLLTGQLEVNIFHKFLEKDYIFLINLLSIYKSYIEKIHDNDVQEFLQLCIKKIILPEIKYIEKYKIIKKNINCIYSDFLNHTINHYDPMIAFASLLPCFVIYNNIFGSYTENKQNPYNQWILSYQTFLYQDLSKQALTIANNIISIDSKKPLELFILAAKHEHLFFNNIILTIN